MTSPPAIPTLLSVLLITFIIALWRARQKKAKTESSTLSYSDLSSSPNGLDTSFEMMIDDVFRITGRGTVAVGKVSAGTVKIGNSLILRKSNGTSRSVSVKGIEMSRKLVNEAERGVTIGLLLGNIEKEDVSKGDRLTAE